ncbi:MAG: Fe-S cluster assembly protein IscX [Anaerolineales bacterium]
MYEQAGNQSLSWASPYAIARALHRAYPQRSLEDLSLRQLESLIRSLDGFQDGPAPVNDELLLEIFQLWYEEQLYGSA